MGAFPFLLPFQLSDIGAPLSAGTLTTLDLLTSNPKATYVDSDLTAANTNPIILNAAGRFRCYLGPGGYKFILRDSQGNLIWSENYNNVGSSTGGGSLQVLDTVAALRAVAAGSTQYAQVMGYYSAGDIGVRTYRYVAGSSSPDDGGAVIAPNVGTGRWLIEWDGKPLSVRVFGAKGDGVFNDAPAVISAQTWALSMNLKTGILFTHVPTFYNLGNDALVLSCFAAALPGGLIRPPVNGLTVTGSFAAGAYRVFYGDTFVEDGGVNFAAAKIPSGACPEWFGAVGDGVTDDLDAINHLFQSATRQMKFPSVTGYAVTAEPNDPPNQAVIQAVGNVFQSSTTYIYSGVTTTGRMTASELIKSLAGMEAPTGTFDTVTADDVDVSNDVIVGRDVSAVRNITAGIDVSADGYLLGKGGSSSNYLRAAGPVWGTITDTQSVGAIDTTLASKSLPGFLSQNGARMVFSGHITFANTAAAKTVVIRITDGLLTIDQILGPSFGNSRRSMFFSLEILRKTGSSIGYNFSSLLYDDDGTLYAAYPGSNTGSVNMTESPLDPNPHFHTVAAVRVDTLSSGNISVENLNASLLAFAMIGTGSTTGDIILRDVEAFYKPAPAQIG